MQKLIGITVTKKNKVDIRVAAAIKDISPSALIRFIVKGKLRSLNISTSEDIEKKLTRNNGMAVFFSAADWDQIKIVAGSHDVSMSKFIKNTLQQWLKEREHPEQETKEELTLSVKHLEILKNSILEELQFQKTMNIKVTSYGYKHLFQRLLHFYISNLDFKFAMDQLGIPFVVSQNRASFFYPVSMKSVNALVAKARKE